MALCSILCYSAVSFFAPMFRPDRGSVEMHMSRCRVLLAVVYCLLDISVLLYKWRKSANIRRKLDSPPYAILAQSDMRRDALRVGSFPYKTLMHVALAFVFFAAEDNLFQGCIGALQFSLPHLSSTNWVGTAVGVFINMGFFFLTFVINLSSQYVAECVRNQRTVTIKVLDKALEEPSASLKEVAFENLQVLDVMLIKQNDKTPVGSFALCGRGLVNMRLANGENKDKPFHPLLDEAKSTLAGFCAKLQLGWVLYVSKEHQAKVIINDDDQAPTLLLQPKHFLPLGTICLQDTCVAPFPQFLFVTIVQLRAGSAHVGPTLPSGAQSDHGRALQPRVHGVHDQARCSVCRPAHAAHSLRSRSRCSSNAAAAMGHHHILCHRLQRLCADQHPSHFENHAADQRHGRPHHRCHRQRQNWHHDA
jgi:hypothetical protein